MGFDFNQGRLDQSSHPFSSSPHPTDNRITTRFHATSLLSCISVILHEGGHALYEKGLPVEQYGTPLGSAISLGMHESQSRWWETRIGQNKSFWTHYLPKLQKYFPNDLKNVKLDPFYRAINKVEPSLIRVEADEVTYPLHVILRFEMEKALIEGSLKVRDIPEAWNSKMQELIGVTPATNSEGCLQDIHWAMGGFGYFPTYTLGNLYAAHLFEAFAKAHPDWEKQIASGNLMFITNWLHENIHQHGRRYTSQELLKKVTGKAFTADAYIKYLNSKYKDIYNLKA
jgi:carboxypeptidase Taq